MLNDCMCIGKSAPFLHSYTTIYCILVLILYYIRTVYRALQMYCDSVLPHLRVRLREVESRATDKPGVHAL